MESDAQNNSRFPVMYSNDTAFLYNSVYVCVLWSAEVAIQCPTKPRNHLSLFLVTYTHLRSTLGTNTVAYNMHKCYFAFTLEGVWHFPPVSKKS